MQEIILSPDYKLFLFSIYAAGVLTGGIIGSIILATKEANWRQREEQ